VVWFVVAGLAAGVLHNIWVLVLALLCVPPYTFIGLGTRRAGLVLAVVVALAFAYGMLTMGAYDARMRAFDTATTRADGPVVLEGIVTSFPQVRRGGVSFELDTVVDDIPMRLMVRSRELKIDYGTRLRLFAELGRSPRSRFPSAEYLRGLGLAGFARVGPGDVEILRGHGGSQAARRALWPLHEYARQHIWRGVGSRSGLALALVLGDRGFLESRIRRSITLLGISHLFALSGLHLGLIAGVLLLVMRPFPPRFRLALIGVLWLYVGGVGPLVSLQRAFVMAALLLVAAHIHRPLRTMTALGNAFVLVVLQRPYVLHSVAFQLSFLATFAVLIAIRPLKHLDASTMARRAWSYVVSTLWVSTVVQVIVAPIILHYFGRISLVAPLATLAFVFPVALLLFAAAAGVGLAAVAPPVSAILLAGVERVSFAFETVLLRCAESAPEPLVLPAPNALMYYAALACLWVGGRRWWLAALALLLLVIAFVPPFRRG
jgi:competence protein ComEC